MRSAAGASGSRTWSRCAAASSARTTARWRIPVRPEAYVEINNFYTATVYEKGAEVIGMLKRLVGDEGYRKALDLYFDRHDGEAATIEDWLQGVRGCHRPRPDAVQALVLAGRHAAR